YGKRSLITIRLLIYPCSPGFCTPMLYALREFHYIDLKMNWTDAQQYCREKYTDLATIESMADNNRLKGTESTFTWIGLHDDPLSWKGIGGNERNSWRWSSTGEFTGRDNHNWRQSEPNYARAKQHCWVESLISEPVRLLLQRCNTCRFAVCLEP
uniref:C-type lectin domain-containing protein n=1 Tax=Labrus bergylta TaxID=56723 RepID=A0A3Q3FCX2_9LABR